MSAKTGTGRGLRSVKETRILIEKASGQGYTTISIGLEDISAARCFEIKRKLKERHDIPIFRNDRRGNAVVTPAGLIGEDELSADYIIPKAFDPRVGKTVAAAVSEAARKTGVARI